MKKIIFAVLAGVFIYSASSHANIIIRSYRHVPCDSWSFNGTCNFEGFSVRGAEADSVQRALYLLADKIERLESKLLELEEENKELKRRNIK